MKKLYFFLMTLMVAFAANAVDYYLIGGFNNWGLKQANCKFTDAGDGTYTLDYAGTLTSGFKINDGTWSGVDLGGNGNLTVGTPYNLVSKGGNIGLAENVENPHIVLNPTAKTLLITGQQVAAEYTYCLWGSWTSSSNWTAVDLTEKDGKWVSGEVAVTLANTSFGVKQMDKSSGAQTDWISAAGTSTIKEAGTFTLKVEGTNFTIAPGTWNFSFDPEAMTLTVTGEGGDDPNPPTPPTNFNGWYLNVQGEYNNWNPSGVAFNADGTAVAKNQAIGAGKFNLKIWNGSEDLFYGKAGEVSVGEVTVTLNGGEMTIAGAPADGVYDVAFDYNTGIMTLTQVGGGDQPPVPVEYTYGLWGSFGTGSDWSGIAMTKEDGKWVADVVAKGTTNFGIQKLHDGEQVNWLWSTDGATISEAGTYTVSVQPAEGSNFGLAEGTWHFSFDPEAMALVVTGEGGQVVIDYTKWYLNVLGEFNEWKDNGVAFNEEGVAVLENLPIGKSVFKIKIWNGTADDYRSNGEAIALNTDYVITGDNPANMTIAGATDEAIVSVKFDAKNNVMYVSGTTAVAEVEVAEGEAVYYNLQGVQVANPENGIYVKVLGGKASKVVVK